MGSLLGHVESHDSCVETDSVPLSSLCSQMDVLMTFLTVLVNLSTSASARGQYGVNFLCRKPRSSAKLAKSRLLNGYLLSVRSTSGVPYSESTLSNRGRTTLAEVDGTISTIGNIE